MLSFLFTQTPLKYLIQSFWRDEAFSYLLAKKNIVEMFVLTSRDFNPPLYYLLLHYWMKVTGYSELSIRFLSLIFFWLTLYIFFLFLINILKIKTRWVFVYLLLFLVNPFLNYYAFEARMYMMFTFFATLSFYLLLRNKVKLYALIALLGLYTHYLMVFVILSQLTYLLLQKKLEQVKRYFRILLFSFLFYLPWLILVFLQKAPIQQFWIAQPNLRTFINIPIVIYTGYESGQAFYSKNALILSMIIFFFFLLSLPKLKKQFVFLIWAFLPPVAVFFISFIVNPFFLPRYLIFSSVGLLLLIVSVLHALNTRLRISFILLLLVLTINYNSLQIRHKEKADVRKVIHEIKTIANPNDLLYVTSVLDFHVGQYYYGEDKTYIYGKSYEEIPSYVGKVLIPKEKLTNTLPLYPQKAFILKENLTYGIQARY